MDHVDRAFIPAEEYRRNFDRSFALPPSLQQAAYEDIIGVRVGGDPFAIRMREIGGIIADRKAVSLPSAVAGFLGISGFRGEIVPVYSLAHLLGYAPRNALRWSAIVRKETMFALAFEDYEGHFRVPLDDIAQLDAGASTRAGVSSTARVIGVLRPIIDISVLFESIKQRASQ